MSDDFFDEGVAIASVSWDGAARSSTFTGILAAPHETKHKTDIDTGKVLTYDNGDPIKQAVLTLQTEYRNFEWTSEVFREKAQKEGLADDGLRKLYVGGTMKAPTLNKGLRDALRKVGSKRPEVGATITVTFIRKAPIPDSKFKRNEFEVAYELPTAASRAKVADLDLPTPSPEPKEPAFAGGNGGPARPDYDSSEPPF